MIVDRSNRRTILVGSIDRIIAVLILPVDNLALDLQLGLVKLAFNFVVFNVFHGMRLPVRIHPLPIIEMLLPCWIRSQRPPDIVVSKVIRLVIYHPDVFIAVPNICVGNYGLLCHYWGLLRRVFGLKWHRSHFIGPRLRNMESPATNPNATTGRIYL